MNKRLIIFSNSSTNIVKLRKNLLSYLHKKKFNITICIPETNNSEFNDLKNKYNFELLIIKYHRSSLNIFSNLLYLYNVYNILKKKNHDLIITFTIKPNILVSLSNIFTKIKIINVITGLGSSFFSNIILKNLIFFLYKISLSKSQCIIFQNFDDRDYFLDKKIIKYNNSAVILGSGVDTTEFNYSYKKFDKKNIQYLYAGRLIKDKGINELINSFKIILEKNNNIELKIAGEIDYQNPSKIQINQINKINNSKIKFVGNLKNLKHLIQESDFCILLSYREGLSNFLIESASTGRPLLSTNVPGSKEIVNQSNGFTCQKKNIKDTIRMINESLSINDNEYQRMSIMSRKIAVKNFDNKIVLNKLLKIIDNILN